MTPEQIAKPNTEHSHQAALFCYAQQSGIPELKWLFAVPNGGLRDVRTANSLKAEGVKSGVSDIMLPVTKYGFNGLFIEMKHEKYRNHKNGGLISNQQEFGEFVIGQGYRFVVCYSWIEARDAILRYLGRMR